MGGDLAPAATVEGALRAHRERGLQVLLVGDEQRLKAELRRLGAGPDELRIHHASEVVEMDEHPGQALRKKKDSSVRVCSISARRALRVGWSRRATPAPSSRAASSCLAASPGSTGPASEV